MTFKRRHTDTWHSDVPGARWFKADLHVHTIDDMPGGRAKFPDGVNGPLDSEETITAYARRFLQSAVEQEVRVLGVTPHTPHIETNPSTSAVWRIVEEWNGGIDDDGKPFKEKIYAVFPGFEPSFNQGKSGLHLLFLFDPEIGYDRFLRAFYIVMGTESSPWRDNELQLSSVTSEEAFRRLSEFHRKECVDRSTDSALWNYITLAPHIDGEKGLLGAQKAQVLKLFQHGEVAGLELGDEKMPDETLKNRDWLALGMERHRQAFFHSSDAYALVDIGKRHIWLKLASPRIEALRQAFIASDSRMRLGYERNGDVGLKEIGDSPDVTVNERPWLKSVVVRGKASFFNGSSEDKLECRFDLSPDLTCIIGGSMTGKSTFLDGLRVHVNVPLPQDDNIRKQVEARGRGKFLGGSPDVTLECPGSEPTAPDHEKWPAVFYAQNELQRLAQEPDEVETILRRLVISETSGIEAREERLNALDQQLITAASNLVKLDGDLADAEQAWERSQKANEELKAFSDAGIEDLHEASRYLRRWQDCGSEIDNLGTDLDRSLQSAKAPDLPQIDKYLVDVLQGAGTEQIPDARVDVKDAEFQARWERIRTHLQSAKDELVSAKAVSRTVVEALKANEHAVRMKVDQALASRGLELSKIQEFQALSRQTTLLVSYKANLDQVRETLGSEERSFENLIGDRNNLVDQQRAAFDRVIQTVIIDFGGRIKARRIDDGIRGPLDRFLSDLGQRGITRWWNDLEDERRPSPGDLLYVFKSDQLATVGMSAAVQDTFRESLGRAMRLKLATIRCRDRYLLELAMDDGNYRRLEDLSGGQRVSVLLSLLLETNDERPLVIDQPEDELDNRFLIDTVLPALKQLKGRRQIIVATHNANIVVNGDADQVIQLEATANQGRVAYAGAIEVPAVRDAIVRTVDGGNDAFCLRRLKYGF